MAGRFKWLGGLWGRALCLALAMCGASCLQAGLYYVNQGTAYHLGDGRLSTTRDKSVVQVHPEIGTLWEQDFTADQNDQVEVVLDRLWGLDADGKAGGRIVEVMIDGKVVGELLAGESGPWRSVVKAGVKKGGRHTLGIRTWGRPDPDDFVFEGVRVQSFDRARIRAVGEARISSPAVSKRAPKAVLAAELVKAVGAGDAGVRIKREAPCGIYGDWEKWIPGRGKGKVLLSVGQDRSVESASLYQLPRGYKASFYFRIHDLPPGPMGRHRVRIRVGQGGDSSRKWTFEVGPPASQSGPAYEGPIRVSHLWGKDPDPLILHPGWNQVTIHYCTENLLWIKINDKVFPKGLPSRSKIEAVTVDVTGVELELGKEGES